MYTPSHPSNMIPLTMLLLLLRRIRDPEHEVDNNRQEKDDREESRSKSIIEPGLAPQSNRFRTPMICEQCIHHRSHCDNCEEEGRDEGRPIAEVQHANCEGAEDDGEVEP
jgi:hypothetical protein